MGTRERKEREREKRRAGILEAAKTAFFTRGFQSATMDQVARAAELSKGTLYLYFSCKEELYVSILLEGLDKLIRRFRQAVNRASGWEAKLRAVGEAFFRYYREEKNYFQILFFLHHGELSPKIPQDLFQECTRKGMEALSYLSGAVEEGMASGDVAPCDPMEAAVVAWGSITGILLLYEEEEHRQFIPMPLESVVKKGIDTLVAGFKKKA
jgi:AcrR family transcriptional regulator